MEKKEIYLLEKINININLLLYNIAKKYCKIQCKILLDQFHISNVSSTINYNTLNPFTKEHSSKLNNCLITEYKLLHITPFL